MKVHVKSVPKTIKVRIVEEPNSFANGGHTFQLGTPENGLLYKSDVFPLKQIGTAEAGMPAPWVYADENGNEYTESQVAELPYHPSFLEAEQLAYNLNHPIDTNSNESWIDKLKSKWATKRAERQAEREALANAPIDYTQPTKQMLFDEAYNRYGTYLSPLVSLLQPKDYKLANNYTRLAGQVTPHTVPNIRYEGKYDPMDINNYANLIAAQNEAAQLAATQGGTRATNAAQRMALQNAYLTQQNDLATKTAEANYARRKAIADEAARIAQANAGINEANAKLLTDADNRRLALLEAAAQARDASDTAWSKSLSDSLTNQISEAGRMKQQDFNNQMYQWYLSQHALKNAADIAALQNKANDTINNDTTDTEAVEKTKRGRHRLRINSIFDNNYWTNVKLQNPYVWNTLWELKPGDKGYIWG